MYQFAWSVGTGRRKRPPKIPVNKQAMPGSSRARRGNRVLQPSLRPVSIMAMSVPVLPAGAEEPYFEDQPRVGTASLDASQRRLVTIEAK